MHAVYVSSLSRGNALMFDFLHVRVSRVVLCIDKRKYVGVCRYFQGPNHWGASQITDPSLPEDSPPFQVSCFITGCIAPYTGSGYLL